MDSDCPPVPAGPCASLGSSKCSNGECNLTYTNGLAPSQVYGNCRKNLCDATGTMSSIADDTNVYQSGDQCAVYSCADGGAVDTTQVGASCLFKLIGTTKVYGLCETDVYGVVVCAQCSTTMATPCTGATTMCMDNVCVAPYCGNGTKDNGETDIDCGGAQCVPCGTGKSCTGAPDCVSKVCTGAPKTCQQAVCTDGVQNGAETDIDCGGGGAAGCSPCTAGQSCLVGSDCESKICMPTDAGPNACQKPTCTDGVQNGTETGVDCGGSCPPCAGAG
jgi:hypothetical protein